jgi:hypothetical protein
MGAAEVVTRKSVLTLITEGHTYREAARRLGISPGLAYLAATGVPADSSDGLTSQEQARQGMLPSAQELCNPRTEAPDRSEHIRSFLSARARRDTQMQTATREGSRD